MEEESFGIREAFKREPEQTNFLIKLVLGGALVAGVFNVLAAVLVNSFAVLGTSLILCLIYAAAIVFTTARLTFSGVGRRYMESSLNKRAAGQEQEPEEAIGKVAEPASFSEAYFLLRLREEVASARRDGREMTLLALEATVPGVEMNDEAVEKVAKEIAEIASNHHGTISHTLGISGSAYVMSMPNMTAKQAKPFVSELVQSLGNYWCHFGVASYPKDGTSADGLMASALEVVQESRSGKSKSTAVA